MVRPFERSAQRLHGGPAVNRQQMSGHPLAPVTVMRATHEPARGTQSMIHSARRLLNARCDELRARPQPDGSNDELTELQHALDRMEAGTWGQCEHCRQAIGHNRLRALPETRCCVDCATH